MKKVAHIPIIFWAIIAAIVLLAGGLGFQYWHSAKQLRALQIELLTLRLDFASTTAKTDAVIGVLSQNLTAAEKQAIALAEDLNKSQEYAKTIESQVGGLKAEASKISGSVNTLEKLSKTDPELLQKYSKVFFLNEHYQPAKLALIDKKYLYSESQTIKIHESVWPHLKALLDAAEAAGQKLYVKSGFRSFEEQNNIKDSYTVTYGAGTANQFSADQGYSEHQLGTTIDFISTGQGGVLDGFDETAVYPWVLANAYKYGFIMSYPKENAYYIFEPWHWRYVGIELATALHKSGKHFYDMDQRDIDDYLVKLFD